MIILGDGMADEPCASLGGLTPLEAAFTPTLDELAFRGRCGMLSTVPPGFSPGSEVSHLSLFGYDVASVFEGRGVLEAAGRGVEVMPGDMVMRCNLISVSPGGIIKSHTAGRISSEEAGELIDSLNSSLADGMVEFHKGERYRHLLKIRGGDKRVICAPPHDVVGSRVSDVMAVAESESGVATAECVNRLVSRSQEILSEHPVNLRRVAEGKDPANFIWPWSPGYKPAMPTLREMYGTRHGCVITAVDIIRGLGLYAGLKPIHVDGATGLADTNYEGKAEAALKALRDGADFVFLHVEASDEAGHEGDVMLKKLIVENLDRRVVRPLMKGIEEMKEDVALAVLPDHPTPCRTRTHSREAVPFVMWHRGMHPDSVREYSERACESGGMGHLSGAGFIEEFLEMHAKKPLTSPKSSLTSPKML